MRFFTADHGAWRTRVGLTPRARMYTVCKPLIARAMLDDGLAAGLDVRVRLMICDEPASRTTRLTYDLPASLMSGLKNRKVAGAAEKLDAKLIALAVHATGAEA